MYGCKFLLFFLYHPLSFSLTLSIFLTVCIFHFCSCTLDLKVRTIRTIYCFRSCWPAVLPDQEDQELHAGGFLFSSCSSSFISLPPLFFLMPLRIASKQCYSTKGRVGCPNAAEKLNCQLVTAGLLIRVCAQCIALIVHKFAALSLLLTKYPTRSFYRRSICLLCLLAQASS